MVRIFSDPKLDPGILAESKVPPTSRLGTSGLGGRRRKKWSKSKTARVFEIATKNKNFNFFFDFFGPDFFGPEIGPRNFGRVESAPPTSRLGTSGPGRVGDKKKWSKSKTGRVFEIATKN